jgi:hypothetical protein
MVLVHVFCNILIVTLRFDLGYFIPVILCSGHFVPGHFAACTMQINVKISRIWILCTLIVSSAVEGSYFYILRILYEQGQVSYRVLCHKYIK